MTEFIGVWSRYGVLREGAGAPARVAAAGVLRFRSPHLTVACHGAGHQDAGSLWVGDRPAGDRADWAHTAAPGRFAGCWWSADGTAGGLAVDRVGSVPIFTYDIAGLLWFATELRVLLDALPTSPPPDEAAVRLWLEDEPLPPERTLHRDVRRLDGGQRVTFGSGGVRRSPRWFPPPPPAPATGDPAAALRDAVSAAVARCRPEDAASAVLLSGGLDSSIVAVHAASIAREAGAPSVAAFAASFPDHPRLDESDYRRAVVERAGLQLVDVPIRPRPLIEDGRRYIRRWGVPAPSGGPFMFSPVACAARDTGHTRLLDGEGGDELFAAAPYLVADLLRSGRVVDAARLSLRFQNAHRLSRRVVLGRVLRHWGLGGLLPPPVHRALRGLRHRPTDDLAWKDLGGPRWWAHLAHALTAGHPVDGWDVLRRHAALDGIQPLHPLLDDVLVEDVLSLDPAAAFDPRADRSLARRAHATLLPPRVLERTSKTDFGPVYVQSLVDHDLQGIRDRLSRRGAPLRAFVSDSAVETLLRRGPGGQDAVWARNLWRFATLDDWLTSR